MSSNAIILLYINDFFVILRRGNRPSDIKTVIVFFRRNSDHTLDVYGPFNNQSIYFLMISQKFIPIDIPAGLNIIMGKKTGTLYAHCFRFNDFTRNTILEALCKSVYFND